jgi:hypothetical protein
MDGLGLAVRRCLFMSASGKRTIVGNLLLTGGTGKLRNIRGVVHVVTIADPAKGFNDTKLEGEYWMEKD